MPKYIYRERKGDRWRYFYSKDEYEAYKNGNRPSSRTSKREGKGLKVVAHPSQSSDAKKYARRKDNATGKMLLKKTANRYSLGTSEEKARKNREIDREYHKEKTDATVKSFLNKVGKGNLDNKLESYQKAKKKQQKSSAPKKSVLDNKIAEYQSKRDKRAGNAERDASKYQKQRSDAINKAADAYSANPKNKEKYQRDLNKELLRIGVKDMLNKVGKGNLDNKLTAVEKKRRNRAIQRGGK